MRYKTTFSEVDTIDISDKILEIVGGAKVSDAKLHEDSDLFFDLRLDSLGFVSLLMELEEIFDIEFELIEMSECQNLGRLISLVKQKLSL